MRTPSAGNLIPPKKPTKLPIRTIVCLTDFSDSSLQALREAVDLAAHFEADIYLLHVISSEDYRRDQDVAIVAQSEEEYIGTVNNGLKEIATRFAVHGVSIVTLIAFGDPADQIVRISREKDADLIVIATHGKAGCQHVAFGSVAEKVVRHATCPVLTIRAVAAQAAASV